MVRSSHGKPIIYTYFQSEGFPPNFLVWSILSHWQVGHSQSRMQLRPALRPRLDHVDPYKLMQGQLYVPDTYTNFIRSNARA